MVQRVCNSENTGDVMVSFKQEIRGEVCFTGFPKTEKEELKLLAVQGCFKPRSGVTNNLTLLVCGPNAGKAKLAKAKHKEVKIVAGASAFLEILSEI